MLFSGIFSCINQILLFISHQNRAAAGRLSEPEISQTFCIRTVNVVDLSQYLKYIHLYSPCVNYKNTDLLRATVSAF